LEKQKEKLTLSLEDLNHEMDREHKTTRNAEQQSSAVNLQLAEANRKLETERQLRTQAQQNTRTVQASFDEANKELIEARENLRLLAKVFDPENGRLPSNLDGAKPELQRTIDIAQKLEASESALRLATDRFSRAEAQLENLRSQYSEDLQENDSRHQNSKRALLEEMNASQVNARSSPSNIRRDFDASRKNFSPAGMQTPGNHKRHISSNTNDSSRSDRTVDTVTYHQRMDLAGELELLQNQLQMSEMKNHHLQSQIQNTPSRGNWQDDSPSVHRMQKLEKENFRLHDMLDDSSKKVTVLEQSIRSGQLSLKEVQTKSHEELYDLINSQEQSRRSLLTAHNAAISELADAKTTFDEVKRTKASIEVDLRDAQSELNDIHYEREQEAANHAQLLQEFSDLQIKLDTEVSKLEDVEDSLDMYKARSDEYFARLEQAEIAVLKASRAEQFAKSQAKEAEETCATVMSERKQMDMALEDLQRQNQQYEERIEDLSADLDGTLQAKKRLQNELEDYRSQRAMDLEDKESSVEQTRKKYQAELATLTNELEIERDNAIHARGENGRIRDELEELRCKWDDEVLNSSTWAKEKSRLEVALQSLSDSRDEAANSHNEAQGKIVELLGQVRHLRSNVDDVAAERDMLMTEKKGLETRLAEAAASLEELSRSGSPTKRDAALSLISSPSLLTRRTLLLLRWARCADLRLSLRKCRKTLPLSVRRVLSCISRRPPWRRASRICSSSASIWKPRATPAVAKMSVSCTDVSKRYVSIHSENSKTILTCHSSNNNWKTWRRAATWRPAVSVTSTAQSRTSNRKSTAARNQSPFYPRILTSPATRSNASSRRSTSCKLQTHPRSSRPSVPSANSAKNARKVFDWSASSKVTAACVSNEAALRAASASLPSATMVEAAGEPARCGRRASRATSRSRFHRGKAVS
jgi:myosin protein heavy chain